MRTHTFPKMESAPTLAETRAETSLYPTTAPTFVRVPACTNVVPVDIDGENHVHILSWERQARALNEHAEAFSHRGTDFIGSARDARENALLRALRLAYSNHHGIALSPDVIYNIVLQGISIHVNRQPEKYRDLLVSFDSGKQEITCVNDALVRGAWDNNWGACIVALMREVVARAPQDSILKLADPMGVSFSTTTAEVEAVAHAAALMDVTSAFYTYVVRTRCGIPFVDVLGQREDWELLATKLYRILGTPELGLQPWLEKLKPLLANFIAAYEEEEEDVTKNPGASTAGCWWQSIYKYHLAHSGQEVTISGWIGMLFPYIHCEDGPAYMENPMVWEKVSSQSGFGSLVSRDPYRQDTDSAGHLLLPPRRFPVGMTSTDFVWKYLGDTVPMKFMAGLVGVTARTESTNVLQPVVGWLVAAA